MKKRTVQLGYCDSDVTVCLLFWFMSIIQIGDVKFPFKQYRYYSQQLWVNSICSRVI